MDEYMQPQRAARRREMSGGQPLLSDGTGSIDSGPSYYQSDVGDVQEPSVKRPRLSSSPLRRSSRMIGHDVNYDTNIHPQDAILDATEEGIDSAADDGEFSDEGETDVEVEKGGEENEGGMNGDAEGEGHEDDGSELHDEVDLEKEEDVETGVSIDDGDDMEGADELEEEATVDDQTENGESADTAGQGPSLQGKKEHSRMLLLLSQTVDFWMSGWLGYLASGGSDRRKIKGYGTDLAALQLGPQI